MQIGHSDQLVVKYLPQGWRETGKRARSWWCLYGFLATGNMRPLAPSKTKLQPSFWGLRFPSSAFH